MAKDIDNSHWRIEQDFRGCHINSDKIAEYLYSKDYRKQSENTVELPYKVWQTVYVLRSKTSNGKNLYLRKEKIDHYRIFGERSYMCFFSDRLSVPNYLWEATVFLTQEEAEAKMKGANNE
jgi:hypothetical protein